MILIKVNHLTKEYGNNKVLDEINLTIPKGTCYGIIGPNGAGKTTLLKIIASILKKSQGDVIFERKTRIGYVPQEICLEQSLSAISNLQFFGEVYGLKGKVLRRQINKVLEEIGLLSRGKDKVKNY